MKVAVLVAALSFSASLAAAQSRPVPSPTAAPGDKVAEAYAQFLIGHHLEEADEEDAAVAAYKRAMELDPTAADIPAQLAGLYLRTNKAQEAMTAAEAAIRIAPDNREANRVLGTIYAALSEAEKPRGSRSAAPDPNVAKAIGYLETAVNGAVAETDPNVRATLARLYVSGGAYQKAIPLLNDLVNEEPGWQDGPMMLAEAYAGAGRVPDGITMLEQRSAEDPRLLPALADFYEREHRWSEAAGAYGRAIQRSPRSVELKFRYASALLNAGGRDNLGKARDTLTEIVGGPATDTRGRALYLLSQAQRRLGAYDEAEAAARQVMAQSPKSPWGYYALAESLEERRKYQAVIEALAPVVAENRGKPDPSFDLSLLLPHLAFAYQETGQFDKAIASFEDARKLAPKDPAIAGYLAEANIAAKKYAAAIEVARAGLADNPGDLRLTRLEAQALHQSGKSDQGIALLEAAVKQHPDEPTRLHRAGAVLLRRRQGRAGSQGAAGRAGEVSQRQHHRLRAGHGVRQAEEIRRCRGVIPPGHCPRSGKRDGVELPRLHAGRARRAARRVGLVPEEGAAN